MKGTVYILINPALPGLVKIGFTTNGVQQRCNEISSSTGVPVPFKVLHSWRSICAQDEEYTIHCHLKPHRTNKKREFFGVACLHSLNGYMKKETINQLVSRAELSWNRWEHTATFTELRDDLTTELNAKHEAKETERKTHYNTLARECNMRGIKTEMDQKQERRDAKYKIEKLEKDVKQWQEMYNEVQEKTPADRIHETMGAVIGGSVVLAIICIFFSL